jgi:hypothetical protein
MTKLLSRRSRDSFAGIPHLYSASSGSERQESTYEPAPVTITEERDGVRTGRCQVLFSGETGRKTGSPEPVAGESGTGGVRGLEYWNGGMME